MVKEKFRMDVPFGRFESRAV